MALPRSVYRPPTTDTMAPTAIPGAKKAKKSASDVRPPDSPLARAQLTRRAPCRTSTRASPLSSSRASTRLATRAPSSRCAPAAVSPYHRPARAVGHRADFSRRTAKLVLISGNCPPLRRSELEYYAMLSKTPVHLYAGSNVRSALARLGPRARPLTCFFPSRSPSEPLPESSSVSVSCRSRVPETRTSSRSPTSKPRWIDDGRWEAREGDEEATYKGATRAWRGE